MEKDKISKIINETKEFYVKNQEEFSKTRQNPWPGWKRVNELISENFSHLDQIKVLDLGCGNGRFYHYLANNIGLKKVIEYTGLDTNDYLLLEALLKYEHASFKNLDVYFNLKELKSKFDVISAFGITHHIPDTHFRMNWFENIGKLVDSKGIFVVTFWDLPSDERFSKAEPATDLEANDFYYGWNDSGTKRYVHFYDNLELENIILKLKQYDFELMDRYESD